jgi:hypothetical protein
MPFVRSYGGAVRVLKQVGNGTASRNWVRIIDYSIKSPSKIKEMKYTPAQLKELKNMIQNLKHRRISPPKSRPPMKPARMSQKQWQTVLKRRESIIKRKSKALSRKTRSKKASRSRKNSRKKYRK